MFKNQLRTPHLYERNAVYLKDASVLPHDEDMRWMPPAPPTLTEKEDFEQKAALRPFVDTSCKVKKPCPIACFV